MSKTQLFGYVLLFLAGIILTSFIGAIINGNSLPFIWFAWIIIIGLVLINQE